MEALAGTVKTYKTKPFKHQLTALRISKDRKAFALLMEQGTGKSKVVIDTIAHLWRKHEIDTVLIIAPKGVAPVWTRQQLPTHMPDDVPYVAALWKAGMSKTQMRDIANKLKQDGVLRVIVMNVEAFGATQSAIDFAIETLDAANSTMIVVDESHRIKTPSAHSTKRIVNLRIRSSYRRILTGTVGDKPFDLYSQFGFLDPDIIGVDSFTAFKSEYAELLPDTSGLMRHIAMRIPKKWSGKYIDEETGEIVEAERNPNSGIRNKKQMVPAYMPTIIATNPDGTPRYRNLEQLQKLIAPHSYRVLKRDCLDLPDKLYSRYYTELGDKQAAIYEQVKEQQRIEWEDERITTFNKLTAILRLQQIVCGYIGDGDELHEIYPKWSENPRILSLLEYIGDRPEKEGTIIWCRFIPDILRVSAGLREAYGEGSVVQFYGKVKDADRLENVARFQGVREIMDKNGNLLRSEPIEDKDRARFMVAQPQSGGVGQTWTAANLSFHYSSTFSLIDRLQAEDRPHRFGQHHPVQYTDLEAEDTVDSIIIASLIAKKEVADVINADPDCAWLK